MSLTKHPQLGYIDATGSDWRAGLSGNPIAIEPPEPAPRLPCDPLLLGQPERLQGMHLSERVAWLVRIGTHPVNGGVLLGVIRDQSVDAGEQGIDYGIADATAVRRIEAKLGGSIGETFDAAVAIVALVRVHPAPTCLVSIAPLPAVELLRVQDVRSEDDVSRFDAYCQARDAFNSRRAAALKLRRRWGVDSMRYREDFPPWFPAFAAELVRKSSRWLELPETAPTPVLPPALPAPTPPTPAPVREGFFKRLSKCF